MEVICKTCKWVSFEVTRKHALAEVKKFNDYFKTLPLKTRKELYGNKGASIRFYEHCFSCDGPYTNFRRALKKELPFGSTIQPIIRRQD